MTRRRWRDSLKSFLKSYIDPEKDEEIKGAKPEIDGKVQKILKFIREDKDDTKEQAANLMEEFRNYYQSLYARYDQLTEVLRKKAQDRGGKDGSSSSSDSSDMDDDSPRKKGKENGTVEDNFESKDDVKNELELSLKEVGDLKIKLSAVEYEKEALSLETQRVIVDLERERKECYEEKMKLEFHLKCKSQEISECIMQVEIQAALQQKKVEEKEDQIGAFKQQVEELQSEKRQKEVQLTNQIIEQERKLREKDEAIIELSKQHKEEIKEITELFQKEREMKNQEIEQVEEQVEDLKHEVEIKADEMISLVENMRTTEVKQRLTNQKLRITEQVLGDKEEEHQKRVNKLEEENTLLKQQIAKLSGIIAVYKGAQMKLVTEISEKANETMVRIDTFGVKFEEDYGHLETRIYEIVNELKVARNWIIGNNKEKYKLTKEITNLRKHLRDEVELKRKIEEVETALTEKEGERRELLKKMGEVEKMKEEREDEIEKIGEEKREAIRQLCIWIDYHNNRYDDLKDMVSKTRE